jgi:hypothetical protein
MRYAGGGEAAVHIDVAGLMLASSVEYEHGAELARGFGVLGVVLFGGSVLTSMFGRGDTTKAAYGTPMWVVRLVGGICLGVAGIGLVMMALGSNTHL